MRNASSNINQHDQYNAFALNYCTHCVITVSQELCGHTMCRPVLVVACAQSIKWKTMDCGWKCIVTNTFLQMQCRIKNRKKKRIAIDTMCVWVFEWCESCASLSPAQKKPHKLKKKKRTEKKSKNIWHCFQMNNNNRSVVLWYTWI